VFGSTHDVLHGELELLSFRAAGAGCEQDGEEETGESGSHQLGLQTGGNRGESVSEADSERSRCNDGIRIEWNEFQLLDRVIDGNGSDVRRVEGHHSSELAGLDAPDRGGAETQRNETIVRRGRTAALQMAQDERA
jgi:hypothetical protein